MQGSTPKLSRAYLMGANETHDRAEDHSLKDVVEQVLETLGIRMHSYEHGVISALLEMVEAEAEGAGYAEACRRRPLPAATCRGCGLLNSCQHFGSTHCLNCLHAVIARGPVALPAPARPKCTDCGEQVDGADDPQCVKCALESSVETFRGMW